MMELADGTFVHVRNPADIEVQVVPPQTRVRVADAPHVTVVEDPAALAAHILAEVPHTAYDDMIDLAVLYENRKA